jgi:hypothetical protein
MPRSLDDLERFAARYPALEEIDLDVGYGSELDVRDVAQWRRFAAILEASSVRTCSIGSRGGTMTLSRDDSGALSRLRLSRADVPGGEALARALTRVTSIESASSKVPGKLARLVR